ncbi:hypothetical protein [Flavobacterium dankookense]|uniref:Tetratricopeptide repeat protein n=1 Tax=Flavobacterium dankookense TaxID=706186 RepID=A0A4R6QGF5_9FLAO|nr:hypothetical protein [Flavobacterium dankookense]TDP61043.1 hypothetical protein BC748_0651 [Flavobacterium dankookense]
MKNNYFLFLLISCCVSFAQINDTDAKLMYQKAEDAYNKENYQDAIKITADLNAEMNPNSKVWSPKVLFLHLKSAYRYFQLDNSSNKSYDNFFILSKQSESMLATIDKTTYPQEKYNEIVLMNGYFQKKTKEFEVQKDRTPQEAIDFLNKCAKDFPAKDDTFQNLIITTFSIDDKYLKIISTCIDNNHKKVVYVDLANIDDVNCWNTAEWKEFIPCKFTSKIANQFVAVGTSCMDIGDFNNTTIDVEKAFVNWNERQLMLSDYFDVKSNLFLRENFSSRIESALQFLVDSSPKKEATTKPVSKF